MKWRNSTLSLESDLAAHGGEVVVPEEITSLIIGVEGPEKSGKTHFGLTAPAPILFMDFDQRARGTIEKFARTKSIVRCPFIIPYDEVGAVELKKKGSTEIPKELHAKLVALHLRATQVMEIACRSTVLRSIVLDGTDTLWTLACMAKFGRLNKVPPSAYREVNTAFEALLNKPKAAKKNLILLSRTKPEWTNDSSGIGKPTGRVLRAGYQSLESITEINLKVKFSVEEGKFSVMVKNCGMLDPFWAGQEFTGAEVELPFIASAITSGIKDKNERTQAWINRGKWA